MAVTPWKIQMAYPDRQVETQGDSDSLSVTVADDRYTVVKCLRRFEDIQPDHFYQVKGHIRCQDMGYKLMYIFYDAQGTELAKGYIMEGKRLVTPENTASMDVEVLTVTWTPGSLTLTDLTVTDLGPYQSRKVRICTISADTPEYPPNGIARTYAIARDCSLRSIDAVAHHKPDLFVLTEHLFQHRVNADSEGYRINTLDGKDPDINALCAKAAKYNAYIICSVRERDAEGLLHNTALLIDRKGNIQDTYRKTHLTIKEMEGGVERGQDIPVFETDFGTIGIQVCWDSFFPEPSRIQAMKGAELIVVPTWGYWEERTRTRALENGVFIASAYSTPKGASVVAPSGEVLAKGTEDTGYAFAEIDLNALHRRPRLSCASFGEPNEYYLCERRGGSIYETILEDPLQSSLWQ